MFLAGSYLKVAVVPPDWAEVMRVCACPALLPL
jgi:hypothetical protein